MVGVFSFVQQGKALDTTGLLLYMPFDGDTNDASGNGNDGTLMGSASLVNNGAIGGALRIDGAGHVEIPHNDSLSIQRDFTIELWVNAEGFPDNFSSFVTKPDSYMLHIDGEGAVDTFKWEPLVWAGGLDAWRTGANVETPMNEWAHIAGVYDGTEYRSYVNGELKGTHTRSGNIDPNTQPLVVGKDNRGCCTARRMVAALDEVRIWTRALSESEIREAMNPTAIEAKNKLATAWGRIKQTR
jgi:hypothetical protein